MSRINTSAFTFLLISILFIFEACSSSQGNDSYPAPMAQALPVVTIQQHPATTHREYTASIEGSRDIEIRPQVSGYIERIYVDEGAYVKQGQLMFKINDRPFVEQLNNARASIAAAEANLANAKINVDKLTPLVQNGVISNVQLQTAQTAYEAAKANVEQARALRQQAQINLGYTQIKAPAEGYIGRIPMKTGSLVSAATVEPLTVLSQNKTMYAYFSLSENDFIKFGHDAQGATIEEKIRKLPPVQLVLSDNSVYEHKGKVEAVSGQFDNSMGTISFRAIFANPASMLRSGSTGRIRIPAQVDSALIVPQESTFELQDRVMVFVVGDSNKVAGVPLEIAGKSGNYYLVKSGITPGQKIVYAGLDRLQDGAVVQPQMITMDSLLRKSPL
jgi:membrane fusion protein (multidrug efflux system)